MRKLLGLVVAAASVVAMAPAWADGMKLNIGYVPNGDFTPVFIAQDKGYFAKAGLDATLTPIPIPSNVPSVLTAQSVDVGPATAVNLFQTAEGGLNLVAITGYNRNLSGKEPAEIVLRSGETYSKPSDIEGKRIGTPGLLSTFDLFLRSWLKKNNVPFEKITQVDVTFPPMHDMVKSGQLDAVIAVDPFKTQIVKDGTGFIAADFMSNVSPDCVGLVWLANRDWAVAHPKERAAFIAGLQAGIEDERKDMQGAMDVEKKYLHFSAPLTDDFNLKLTSADLEFFQDQMLQVGFLKKKLDLSTLTVQ